MTQTPREALREAFGRRDEAQEKLAQAIEALERADELVEQTKAVLTESKLADAQRDKSLANALGQWAKNPLGPKPQSEITPDHAAQRMADEANATAARNARSQLEASRSDAERDLKNANDRIQRFVHLVMLAEAEADAHTLIELLERAERFKSKLRTFGLCIPGSDSAARSAIVGRANSWEPPQTAHAHHPNHLATAAWRSMKERLLAGDVDAVFEIPAAGVRMLAAAE